MNEFSPAGSALLDARGIPITAGDTVIYGFGVGRSVAMAEAVVLGEEVTEETDWGTHLYEKVSLTPSGRVWIRVVRRSYGSGSKPKVHVAPDRLVVLKPHYDADVRLWTLPPSDLPTQDEVTRHRITNLMEAYTNDLRADTVPDRHCYDGWTLERFHAYAAKRLKELRKELREHDDRTT
jgi:hypothetical protein